MKLELTLQKSDVCASSFIVFIVSTGASLPCFSPLMFIAQTTPQIKYFFFFKGAKCYWEIACRGRGRCGKRERVSCRLVYMSWSDGWIIHHRPPSHPRITLKENKIVMAMMGWLDYRKHGELFRPSFRLQKHTQGHTQVQNAHLKQLLCVLVRRWRASQIHLDFQASSFRTLTSQVLLLQGLVLPRYSQHCTYCRATLTLFTVSQFAVDSYF